MEREEELTVPKHRQDVRQLRLRADRARVKGRVRRAIRLYRRVLAGQPDDPAIHRKLAPLLARRRRREESWQSYQVARRSLEERGFDAHAGGLLREAVELLPRNVLAWKGLAEIEISLGRTTDARNTLLEGRRYFRGARRRADAIALLSVAHQLDPDDVEIGRDLARQLRRSGRPRRAQEVLYQLLERIPNRRRSLRRSLFLTTPTVRSLWAWIRCPRTSTWTGLLRHSER